MRDINFMSLAIRLAKKNLGITHPNPTVGSVICKNDKIIATGITAPSGRPHAEEIALKKAGSKAAGATLYVTLEPCCHQHKTSHCTDLIIKSKISRVVISTIDPDLKTSNLGIEKLQKAGIKVEIGLLEEKAKEINIGFFATKNILRPFITLKLATSLDGKIALKNFESQWISNARSRQYSHYLRAKNEAILIGANTVKKDDPMLNCRINGLEHFSPIRIIISSKIDIDEQSKIIQSAKQYPTYIATTNSNKSNPELQKFIACGVKIIFCDEESKDKINLEDLLQKISALGINNLMIEGGQMIAGSFLKKNLIDQIIWVKSNFIIGNDGIAAIGDLNLQSLSEIENLHLNFTKTDYLEFNDDTIIIYRNLKNIADITKTAP